MSPSTYRPRISRETRLLLTTAVLALTALWVLARIRFPDRPVTPNPVPPLLSQLAAVPSFSDLAAEVSQLQTRIEPMVRVLDSTEAAGPRLLALDVGDARAVTLDVGPPMPADALLARDPASGLAVLRSPSAGARPPVVRVPARLDQPRYLISTDVVERRVVLRPVFIGALEPSASPLWPGEIWLVPTRTDVAVGSFLFTNNAEFVGLVVEHGTARAVVPAGALFAEVTRLVALPATPEGDIGIQVQALSPALEAATGAPNGAVVTWVDAGGAAAGRLMVGDVIEGANGQLIETADEWTTLAARLHAGDRLALLVRRDGAVQDVTVEARPQPGAPTTALGASLQASRGGAMVVRVEPWSAAARAGLRAGDLITLAGSARSPTPAQVLSAFAAARDDRPALLGVTRGDSHLVLALAR